MRKFFLLLAALGCATLAGAQGISQKELSDMRSVLTHTAQDKALRNAMSSDNVIKAHVLNRDAQGKIDHYFKYRVNVSGITNQLKSGRCWMFASLNVLRPEVMKKYNIKEFDFSHNYLYFYDILEKANMFLDEVVATAAQPYLDRKVTALFSTPIFDGGYWNAWYNLAVKYGVVPQSVMPETEHSNSTAEYRGVLNERLRGGGYQLRDMIAGGAKTQAVQGAKKQVMADVYKILVLFLGEPPTQFTWRYQTKKGEIKALTGYTPLQFFHEIVTPSYNENLYATLANDPSRPYYKMYSIDYSTNMTGGLNNCYLNVPSDVLKQAAMASIKDSVPLYASCDVGKQNNRTDGIMDTGMYDYASLLGMPLNMDKAARIRTRHSAPTHAMLIVAVDADGNDRPTKWEFENSWGATSGHKGYLTFTDAWFDAYLYKIVVQQKYLDAKTRDMLKQAPEKLPMWDFMW